MPREVTRCAAGSARARAAYSRGALELGAPPLKGADVFLPNYLFLSTKDQCISTADHLPLHSQLEIYQNFLSQPALLA